MSVEKYPNNPMLGRREIVDGKMRFFGYQKKRTRSQDFSLSGPLRLTEIDWTNEDYKRSAVASLVQGVYVAELDHQCEGSQALASPWWEFFNFEMLEQLEDDVDSSIFGAIYKFTLPASHSNLSTDGCPCYVIAFRGTLLKRKTWKRDLKLDLKIIQNKLHLDCRFKKAMQAVGNMVDSVGSSNVWLAGHSLGSAIALLAGKTMAKEGFRLESFLFNPPYPSVPIEKIPHEKVKDVIRFGVSAFRVELASAMESGDPFPALSAWVPHIFVNQADCICSGYVGYFDNKKEMKKFGSRGMKRLDIQLSLRSLATGKVSEPMHRFPSANRTVNSTRKNEAHRIRQWWGPMEFNSGGDKIFS